MTQTSLIAGATLARPPPPARRGVRHGVAAEPAAAAAGTPPTSLVVERVSLSFGGVAALRDVSLVVAPGEIRAVIGPNGAGKSSLLNVVSGLYAPQSGRVTIDGAGFAAVPAARLARLGVARTFQNLALFGGLSVADNIAAGVAFRSRAGVAAQLLGLPRARADRREAAARAAQAIAFFHLEPYTDRSAATLPYGIQKRVELARAMVAHPHLLLLDEPLAGMQRAEKQELARYIRTLRDAYGTAVVLIEHDVGVVMDVSDRVAVLDHGRKIADGTPAAIAADQAVIDAYLGTAHDDDPED